MNLTELINKKREAHRAYDKALESPYNYNEVSQRWRILQNAIAEVEKAEGNK